MKHLAPKTHRGLRGRVEQGRSAGGRCFGYRVRRELDARGEAVRGRRKIDQAEAQVAPDLFRVLVGGLAAGHRQEARCGGHSGTDGRPWQDITIRGHAGRGTGVLNNAVYRVLGGGYEVEVVGEIAAMVAAAQSSPQTPKPPWEGRLWRGYWPWAHDASSPPWVTAGCKERWLRGQDLNL